MVVTFFIQPLSAILRKGLLLSLLFFFFSACSDRARDNPFDPGNNAPPPLSLELSPQSDKIQLDWSLTQTIADISGFRLYRAIDSVSALSPFIDLPATARSFTDTTTQLNKDHFYAMTILAAGVESNRTSTLSSYTGLGRPLIFNRGGYSIERVSYDLRHQIETIESSFYQPREWVLLPEEDLAWILFARFPSGITKLNLLDNTRTETILDTLRDPEDLAYNPVNETLYILDQFVDHIYLFKNSNITGGIALDEDAVYFKIEVVAQENRLYAIAEDRLTVIELGTLERQTQTFQAGYEGWDIEKIGSSLNVLSGSSSERLSRLFIWQNGMIADTLQLDGFFYRLTTDSLGGGYYMAEAFSGADDRLVKLSETGARLAQLPEGFSNLEQIVINPLDQSVLAIDPNRDRIFLYDANGNKISESRTNDGRSYLNVPLRVYVE